MSPTISAPNSTFTECYVAFIDILGMKSLVANSGKDPELYQRLLAALLEAKTVSPFWREHRDISTGDVQRWSLQVQAFSDCLVLFIPTKSQMLSWLLASVRRFHDRMVGLEVCLRGAIVIGGMHWEAHWSIVGDGAPRDSAENDIAVETPVAFGPGLVAAYELESGCAVYPRILVSNNLYDHIVKLGPNKGRASPLAGTGNLSDFVRQDFDGLWHLDLLHQDIDRKDVLRQVKETDEQGRTVVRNEFDETTYKDRLSAVGSFVVKQLHADAKEAILAKYQWLARYYNEKAKEVGLRSIPIFKDALPKNAIPFTNEAL